MTFTHRVARGSGPVVALTLGFTALAWPPTATARTETPLCAGLVATIVGTHGDDVLNGTDGPDVIVGLAGNDQISGLGGDDVLCGNKGKDNLTGDAGSDDVRGNGGHDELLGGDGDDTVRGGAGPEDHLFADAGDDHLIAGTAPEPGHPYSYSPARPDVFLYNFGATGPVTIDISARSAEGPGVGHDKLGFARPRLGAFVRGSQFDDTILGGGGPDRLESEGGADIIYGRGGDDYINLAGAVYEVTGGHISGGPGRDRISVAQRDGVQVHGGSGVDLVSLFDAGASVALESGDDFMSTQTSLNAPVSLDGGAGTDSLDFNEYTASGDGNYGRVTIDLGAGRIDADDATGFDAVGFENAAATSQETSVSHWVLRGTSGPNRLSTDSFIDPSPSASLYGFGGDDTLNGMYEGGDLLDGGEGTDSADASGGDTCASIETVTAGRCSG